MINKFYRSHSSGARNVLFHEMFHARDYSSGFDKSLLDLIGNTGPDRNFYNAFTEVNAYRSANKLFISPAGERNLSFIMREYLGFNMQYASPW